MGGLADKNVTREPKARNKGKAPGTGPMGNLGPPDETDKMLRNTLNLAMFFWRVVFLESIICGKEEYMLNNVEQRCIKKD